MILIFTIMMKYYHWVIEQDTKLKVVLWKVTQIPFKLIAGVFFVLDILYNYVLSIWMMDVPVAWDETVSWRMDRYIDNLSDSNRLIDKWRVGFAKGLCKILSFSDPGHCGGI